MVSSQADEWLFGGGQSDEPIQNTLGIRATVHVVAEEDEQVLRSRLHNRQQVVEGRGRAVDVADGKGSHGNTRERVRRYGSGVLPPAVASNSSARACRRSAGRNGFRSTPVGAAVLVVVTESSA